MTDFLEALNHELKGEKGLVVLWKAWWPKGWLRDEKLLGDRILGQLEEQLCQNTHPHSIRAPHSRDSI